LTVHYISQDFHLLTHLLETREFGETHMAEHITAELEAILADWELVVSCPDHTSDKENGLVNQVEFLGLEAHYGMYNHCVIQRC